MSLKVYYDLLSQPSRAVIIFLNATRIPFQPVPITLRKGAQLTKQFREINRFHTVPTIENDGFRLMESNAILRYLCRENSVEDHWYPKDSKKQAMVDEYLEWQHHNTRFLCNFYFQRKYLMPLRTGVPTKESLVQEAEDRVVNCLEKIQDEWLNNRKFLAGNEISIADILAVCELEQTRIAGFDPRTNFPVIESWMKNVRNILNPHYDEAHSVVYKLAERTKAK